MDSFANPNEAVVREEITEDIIIRPAIIRKSLPIYAKTIYLW